MSPGQSDNNGAAGLADKLGALSVGGTTKSDSTATDTAVEHEKCCSSCGKTGDGLKKCAACKCVYYCSIVCQKDHRGGHKAACKRIKKILNLRGNDYVELAESLDPLSADEIPRREDCPICLLPLPLDHKRTIYMSCCGKRLCSGCEHEKMSVKIIEESKDGQFDSMDHCCAFCRAPPPNSDEDILRDTMKRAEVNDAVAIGRLGNYYLSGDLGLRKDKDKGLALLIRAANLGDPHSCYKLGCIYKFGHCDVICDDAVAIKYWEPAAEKGHVGAREHLAHEEEDNGNFSRAKKHWRIAAALGSEHSMFCLIGCFQTNTLRHNDLAICLQSYDKAWIGQRSEQRSNYERFLLLEKGEATDEYWRDRVIRAMKSD